MFPKILSLSKIYLSFPITNAYSVRSLSALKRLKSWLRNSMGQKRLSNVDLLNIESDEADKLSNEKILEIFVSKKNRKLKFF